MPFVGAYAFMALEQTNEKEVCVKNSDVYNKMVNSTASSLWGIFKTYKVAEDPTAQLSKIEDQINTFFSNYLSLTYDSRNCSNLGQPDGDDYNWNFAGALLFSITIFTTVGKLQIIMLLCSSINTVA